MSTNKRKVVYKNFSSELKHKNLKDKILFHCIVTRFICYRKLCFSLVLILKLSKSSLKGINMS